MRGGCEITGVVRGRAWVLVVVLVLVAATLIISAASAGDRRERRQAFRIAVQLQKLQTAMKAQDLAKAQATAQKLSHTQDKLIAQVGTSQAAQINVRAAQLATQLATRVNASFAQPSPPPSSVRHHHHQLSAERLRQRQAEQERERLADQARRAQTVVVGAAATTVAAANTATPSTSASQIVQSMAQTTQQVASTVTAPPGATYLGARDVKPDDSTSQSQSGSIANLPAASQMLAQGIQARPGLTGRTTTLQPAYRALPGPTDFMRRDSILAFNVRDEQLRMLRDDGFQPIGSVALFGSVIQNFRVPPNQDAEWARKRLTERNIASNFNFLHRPYHLSKEGGPVPTGRATLANRTEGCTADRCYGDSLIGWHPRLAACAKEIRVGIVDTDYDRSHPTFRGRDIQWGTFLPEGTKQAANWHGTGILSLLSGNPKGSTPGLIPYGKFFAADAFYADSAGEPVTDTASLLDALRWMSAMDVKVVNMSIAGPEDETLHAFIKALTATGMVFVAAAGNAGPNAPPSFPAAYAEVIAVTAVNRNGEAYRNANRGKYIDVAAPGVDVWTAFPGSKEGPQTGTSFAVPYVTAVVAATYPKDELEYRGKALATKRVMLSRLAVKDLGAAAIYGRGLLQAPTECPRQPWLVTEKPASGDEWGTTVVQRVSLQDKQ
jgi:hypothetical protein